MTRKRIRKIFIVLTAVFLFFAALFFAVRYAFRRPYADIVTKSSAEDELVYAIMKAESGFNERAVSRAGAVGLMQLMPSTARFVCEREGVVYDGTKLSEGDYNVTLGCMYLVYLLSKFEVLNTAVAAYNAGEGTVEKWLNDKSLSRDGKNLTDIPYRETREYVKKVCSYRKIYKMIY